MTDGSRVVLVLKNLLFTVLVPGTVAVYVPLRIAEDRQVASGAALAAGLALLAAGAAVYAWCVWDFAAFGRGTPAPIDAPRRLVVRGLYRYARNPMYVGVLAVILGQAALFRSAALALYALGVGLCFHLFVVLYEEPHLARVFGLQYDVYRSKVPRWLPRVPEGPPR
jgi:protein-S-isoprenylcysteine O-methyltransferase Ste14